MAASGAQGSGASGPDWCPTGLSRAQIGSKSRSTWPRLGRDSAKSGPNQVAFSPPAVLPSFPCASPNSPNPYKFGTSSPPVSLGSPSGFPSFLPSPSALLQLHPQFSPILFVSHQSLSNPQKFSTSSPQFPSALLQLSPSSPLPLSPPEFPRQFSPDFPVFLQSPPIPTSSLPVPPSSPQFSFSFPPVPFLPLHFSFSSPQFSPTLEDLCNGAPSSSSGMACKRPVVCRFCNGRSLWKKDFSPRRDFLRFPRFF